MPCPAPGRLCHLGRLRRCPQKKAPVCSAWGSWGSSPLLRQGHQDVERGCGPGGSAPSTYTRTRWCTHQHTQHTSPHRPPQTPSTYGQVQRHGHQPTHTLNTEAHAGRDVTHASTRMCTHTHPHTPATVRALGEPHGCVHGPSQTHRHRRARSCIRKHSHVCHTHAQVHTC